MCGLQNASFRLLFVTVYSVTSSIFFLFVIFYIRRGINMSTKKAAFFDIDGTLWNTCRNFELL